MPPGTATAPARNDVGSARDDAPGAQQVARSFVIALHSSLRAIRLYPMENAAVRNSLVELEGYTAKVFSTFAQCELRAVGEYLFVNDTRLRLQLDNYAAVAHVLGRMHLAGVGGVAQRTVAAGCRTLASRARRAIDGVAGRCGRVVLRH